MPRAELQTKYRCSESVTARRTSAGLEILCEEDNWNPRQSDPSQQMEAIREPEQTRLLQQLIIDAPTGMRRGVRMRKSKPLKILRQRIARCIDQRQPMRQRVAQPRLVQIHAPLMEGCDKRHAETTTPVTRQIRQARSLVVLLWRQIRIRHHAHRHKEERIAKSLHNAGHRVMKIICLRSEAAV